MNPPNKKPMGLVLCGLGSAGRARLAAAEKNGAIHLIGTVSRRSGTLSFEEALFRADVDAVAISTESADHAPKAEAALMAGKHVLCDYPLALSGAKASELFHLAQKKKLVLHVEHIGLLTQAHLQAREERKKAGRLIEGVYHFEGGWNDKLADVSRWGPPPFFAVSRLLQVADLFGKFQSHLKEYHADQNGFVLSLDLEFEAGGHVAFTEKRSREGKRHRLFKTTCEKGSVTLDTEAKSENLFGQDLDWFVSRVRGEKNCYYNEELMMGILEELEKIL